MEKLDLTKSHPEYYKALSNPKLVELPIINYLSIKGVGAPENQRFLNSIDAIYKVAYTIKFHCKSQGQDFKVPKMEAQWWSEKGKPFEKTAREEWCWDIIIRMPDFVSKDMVEDAVEKVVQKKKVQLACEVHLVSKEKHKVVQALHVGSYEEEAPTIEKMFGFIKEEGLTPHGYHHEIYMTDPRKTPEERLRTIIRYAVK